MLPCFVKLDSKSKTDIFQKKRVRIRKAESAPQALGSRAPAPAVGREERRWRARSERRRGTLEG